MSENKLICIVDDDASVRDSLSLVLGLKGYDCRTYESAESFLSSLPNRPACIILDLKMTGMNGLELQNRLLSLKVPVQIIFLTAFADVQVMREAFLGNAVDFLEKPFVLEQLLESINRSWEVQKSEWEKCKCKKPNKEGFSGCRASHAHFGNELWPARFTARLRRRLCA